MAESIKPVTDKAKHDEFKKDATKYALQAAGKLAKISSYARSNKYQYTPEDIEKLVTKLRAEIRAMKVELTAGITKKENNEEKKSRWSL